MVGDFGHGLVGREVSNTTTLGRSLKMLCAARRPKGGRGCAGGERDAFFDVAMTSSSTRMDSLYSSPPLTTRWPMAPMRLSGRGL